MQVLCSSFIFREDVDIGSAIVGDLYKKSRCLELRVQEEQEGLINLRRMQLQLLFCGLGLEEPTDDIAPDVAYVRSLIGELPALPSSGFGLVAEVQAAISLDSLDSIPMPSQRSLEGLEGISTQDLALSQFNSTQCSPNRIVLPPPELSQHESLCNMHSKNPRSPRTLSEGPGPWFSRALSVDNNRDGVESKGDEGAATKTEVALEAVQHEVGTHDIANVRPTALDLSLDDVLATTTLKPDGR